jgi:hypothetical protein
MGLAVLRQSGNIRNTFAYRPSLCLRKSGKLDDREAHEIDRQESQARSEPHNAEVLVPSYQTPQRATEDQCEDAGRNDLVKDSRKNGRHGLFASIVRKDHTEPK